MIKFGWVTKRKNKAIDVICDCCGKSVKISMGKSQHVNHEKGTLERPKETFTIKEYAGISISWGYYSHADGLKTEAQLCEKCWAKARKALEKIGVKFTDTNYLANNEPWRYKI